MTDYEQAQRTAPHASTVDVLQEVGEERVRQDQKWGDLSGTPDGTGPLSLPLTIPGWVVGQMPLAVTLAQMFTQRTDLHARTGELTMADIILEEVFEAMAEDDADKLRKELIQVAAVAVAWCEYLDTRGALPEIAGV